MNAPYVIPTRQGLVTTAAINVFPCKVPYELKDRAKALGARWDSIGKCWVFRTLESYQTMLVILDAHTPKGPPKVELGGNLHAIVDRFRAAKANGLNFPALMFYSVGGFAKVKLTLAPDSGKNAGFLYLKGDGNYLGKIDPAGQLFPMSVCNDQTKEFLFAFADNPVGISAANGKAAGRCCYCARELTDGRSLTAGYGPICADKWSLPWG